MNRPRTSPKSRLSGAKWRPVRKPAARTTVSLAISLSPSLPRRRARHDRRDLRTAKFHEHEERGVRVGMPGPGIEGGDGAVAGPDLRLDLRQNWRRIPPLSGQGALDAQRRERTASARPRTPQPGGSQPDRTPTRRRRPRDPALPRPKAHGGNLSIRDACVMAADHKLGLAGCPPPHAVLNPGASRSRRPVLGMPNGNRRVVDTATHNDFVGRSSCSVRQDVFRARRVRSRMGWECNPHSLP